MAAAESFEPLKDESASPYMVPLEDVRKMKRSGSHGSDKSLEIASDGMEDSLDYRLQAMDVSGKKKISLWHDVSLVHIDQETNAETPYMNFVCEIPKFTRYVSVVVCQFLTGVFSRRRPNLLVESTSAWCSRSLRMRCFCHRRRFAVYMSQCSDIFCSNQLLNSRRVP